MPDVAIEQLLDKIAQNMFPIALQINDSRQMFSLTNSKSRSSGIEFTLPGCHCNVGGAYENTNYQ